MISIRRIVEQQGFESQYYDLGKDFSVFRRTLDGTTDQIKQKFEETIGTKLNGKRIRARASRGYKQYVKDYEFDVSKVTLDDYYDNYVVVAHDSTTPKPKEYFLKPGFKIQIIGQASGKPSQGLTTPGGTPSDVHDPENNPDTAQSQPMAQANANHKSIESPLAEADTEKEKKEYDAYSIDNIIQDISWLPQILIKPKTAIRDFTKGLGWMTRNKSGKMVALFDLKFPKSEMKIDINNNTINAILKKVNTKSNGQFELVSISPNQEKNEFVVRLKKTMD